MKWGSSIEELVVVGRNLRRGTGGRSEEEVGTSSYYS